MSLKLLHLQGGHLEKATAISPVTSTIVWSEKAGGFQ